MTRHTPENHMDYSEQCERDAASDEDSMRAKPKNGYDAAFDEGVQACMDGELVNPYTTGPLYKRNGWQDGFDMAADQREEWEADNDRRIAAYEEQYA